MYLVIFTAMQIVLFEDRHWSEFLPLVYTRPVGDLRMGMMTMAERYAAWMNVEVVHETRAHLQSIFLSPTSEQQLHVNARLFPDQHLVAALHALQANEVLHHNGQLLARRISALTDGEDVVKEYAHTPIWLDTITDLFSKNAYAMASDFALIGVKESSAPVHSSNVIIGHSEMLYIHPSAKVYASSINTLDGPVYIDEDAEVMEGSHIRGPFYLGKHSTLKLGTKIYGATTIGPHCKVGGEVSNSVVWGFSNKAHDGFLGNSLIGEWCNLGADTNTSNLKNNYSSVRIWNYTHSSFTDTGLTFCGLIMGDHSKCGINTMFNTGTVAGVCANVFGAGFPDKHVASFLWGGAEGWEEYQLEKALTTIEKVMQRRSLPLTEEMREMLSTLFDETRHQRL